MPVMLANALVKNPAALSAAKKVGFGALGIAFVALIPHAYGAPAANAASATDAPSAVAVALGESAAVTERVSITLDAVEGTQAEVTFAYRNCIPGSCIGIVRPPYTAMLSRGRSAYYAGYTIRLDSLAAAGATLSISP